MDLEIKANYIIRFFRWLGIKKTLVLVVVVIIFISLAKSRCVIGYEPYNIITGKSGTSNTTIEAIRTATISEDISVISIATELAGEMNDEIALITTFNDLNDKTQAISKKNVKYIIPAEASRVIYPSVSCYLWKEKSASCLKYLMDLGNVSDPDITTCILLIVDGNYYYGNVRTRLLGIGGSFEVGIIDDTF